MIGNAYSTSNLKAKWYSIFFFSLLIQLEIIGQVKIQFQPTLNGKNWVPGMKHEYSNSRDTLILVTLRFYISDITFYPLPSTHLNSGQKHYLLDAERPDGLSMTLNDISTNLIDSLGFTFGIDSLTQINGPLGQDLDPIHGMYWTWQTGFIHLKMEGTFTGCASRKKRFQFHVGGFEKPWNTVVRKLFPVQNSDLIIIQIPIEKILKLDNNNPCEIMRPGKEAMELAERFIDNLFIKQ